ncbi:MAG: hypothetical protein ACLGI6_21230, partial [Gammaproteobacteria bacterium]
ALPRGIHPQSIGAIMDQPGMGMGIGLGSARGTGLEPFAVDPALAQFTSGGGFGFNPFMPNAPFQGPLGIQGLPFGLGTPGNQRGW